jgi:hypothetical protein
MSWRCCFDNCFSVSTPLVVSEKQYLSISMQQLESIFRLSHLSEYFRVCIAVVHPYTSPNLAAPVTPTGIRRATWSSVMRKVLISQRLSTKYVP